MALAPLSQTIFLTEDGSVPNGEKAVTIPPMGIAPSITLGALTLSAPIVSGTPMTGTIVGSSDGSFIADSVPGLTIDSPARTYVWDGSGPVASYPAGLTETHPDATNSGRSSPVTISAAIVKVTVSGTPPTTGQAGTAYAFAPVAANGAGTKVWTKNRTLLTGQTFSTTTGAIGGTPTEAGTITGLIITVTDDTGSAATTATTVTISAAPVASPVTIDSVVRQSGQEYTFTARRATNLSQAENRSLKLAPSADYLPAATAGELADLTAVASFAANSATAPVTFAVPVTVQPE